jgi:hypothetical protein
MNLRFCTLRSVGAALLAAVFCLSAISGHADTDTPRAGLMWNRTGLPAVFPLQVKSAPGEDYFLRLIDVETGEAVLAAYIDGGRFFRVLVPPGTYTLRFAAGQRWQGEETLFGAGGKTRQFDFPDPLSFEIRGLRKKSGHLVDITQAGPGQMAQATSQRQEICQRLAAVLPGDDDLMPTQRQATGTAYPGEYDGLLELDRPLRVEPLLDTDETPDTRHALPRLNETLRRPELREYFC